ncbi:hypothetical protein LOTGIDRAFT_158520 [Lottia gigantea]|uniref:G-protein coupled receptors family 1 profile domain-containing protein n=1 Tax=Lottia gigantea TaxID=225164 RepID=V4AWP8_LOTGI|nr:hypothetical protein LOTGIDRAFT_158520 [Lottia gigantea]ESO99435.1 hypothetical protein LOTGIDRAFT_158520 [Lottia gigantea]
MDSYRKCLFLGMVLFLMISINYHVQLRYLPRQTDNGNLGKQESGRKIQPKKEIEKGWKFFERKEKNQRIHQTKKFMNDGERTETMDSVVPLRIKRNALTNNSKLLNVSNAENGTMNDIDIVTTSGVIGSNRSQDERRENDVSSIINEGFVSKETYDEIEKVTRYLTFVTQVLVVLVCTINIIVFSRRPMRSPTSAYLIALNSTELLSVTSGVMTSVVGFIFGDKAFVSYGYLFMGLYMSNYFTVATRRCTFVFTCLVAAERFLAVAFPLKSKHMKLVRKPIIFILATVTLSFVFHLFSVLKYNLVPYLSPNSNETFWKFQFTKIFLENKANMESWSIASKIIFVYIQLIGCLILNIGIVIALKRHRMNRLRLNSSEDVSKVAQEKQTTVTILVSTFVFVLLALPVNTSSVVANLDSTNYGLNTKNHYLFYAILHLGGWFELLSDCTNFISYIVLSTQFRLTFIDVFGNCSFLGSWFSEERYIATTKISTISSSRFIQLNINGLNVPERKTQLVQLLQRKQYDAVFLQESKLGSRNKDPIINGYTLIRLNRPNALNHRSGGGLAIYIKNGISHSEAPLEAQAVSFTDKSKVFSIVNIYRPEVKGKPQRFSEYQYVYDQLPGTDNIVLGDFNAKHVLWGSPTTDTNGRHVAEFIEANDLVSINDGSITYVGAIAPLGSHLDLTLVSSRLAKDCTWEATCLRVFQQITDNLTKPNQRLPFDYQSTRNTMIRTSLEE